MKKNTLKISRWKRFSKQEKIVLTIVTIVFTIYSLYLLYPYLWTFLNSLKTVQEYYNNSFALPISWKFSNFVEAFNMTVRNTSVIGMFFNSLLFTFTFAGGTILCSTLTAYVVSKYKFPGQKLLYPLAVFIQVLPVFGTMGAGYRLVYNLGINDNFLLLWIIGAGGFDFAFVMMYAYFQSVSWNYAEAAFIDGAGNSYVFFKIMMPQAIAPMIALFVSSFIGYWNDYMTPFLYLTEFPTLSVGIYALKTLAPFQGGMPVYFAAILLSLIPVIILFGFFQKKILNAEFSGGLKG